MSARIKAVKTFVIEPISKTVSPRTGLSVSAAVVPWQIILPHQRASTTPAAMPMPCLSWSMRWTRMCRDVFVRQGRELRAACRQELSERHLSHDNYPRRPESTTEPAAISLTERAPQPTIASLSSLLRIRIARDRRPADRRRTVPRCKDGRCRRHWRRARAL